MARLSPANFGSLVTRSVASFDGKLAAEWNTELIQMLLAFMKLG
jgi:hypothetical protein